MSHEIFVSRYGVPVKDPRARRPELCEPGKVELRLTRTLGMARRHLRGRRLAYVDSHFPWARSGFRYADAMALLEARRDTVFFSLYETTDPFPAPVLPLAQFPRLAPRLGITDVYGVFLNFAAGLLGLSGAPGVEPGPTDGLNIADVVKRERIRTHICLYPGGGLVLTEPSLGRVKELVAAAHQVFSYVPEVLERFPDVVPIDQAIIDTSFYTGPAPDLRGRPVEILFAADAAPRKGLDVCLAMVGELRPHTNVRLHVAGPHEPQPRDEAVTFHGWQEREQLRALHARCPIFVSPVRAGLDKEGEGGMVDGFPTAAASEAMSSGCLLISSNPAADHRILRPGVDYIECAPSAAAFARAVRQVVDDPDTAATVARSGSARVRQRMSVQAGARQRLRLMGL